MSDFHRKWQGIFPRNCLEVKFENNRADIYLKNDKKFNLSNMFVDFESKNLVIEIQNSKISREDLIQRQNVYKCIQLERQLLWIFNLQKCQVQIGRVKTKEELVIKFIGGDTSFMNLLNIKDNKACILLDNGTYDLYHVSNNPKCDKEYIEVTAIDRTKFLQELSIIFNLDLKWEYGIKMKDTIFEFELPIPKNFVNSCSPPGQEIIKSKNFDIFTETWLSVFPNECIDFKSNRISSGESTIEIKKINQIILSGVTFNMKTEKNMIWIVDLSTYEHDIEHIKTYAEEKYIIRFLNNSHRLLTTLASLKSKLNILFDTGVKYLYHLLNVFPHGNYVQVTLIDRSIFLNQINLKWPDQLESNDFDEYDYETLISSLQLTSTNKNNLRKCFYLMELDSAYIIDYPEYWKGHFSSISIGKMLSRLSNKNYQIRDIWIKWMMKNKPKYDDHFPFGKHKGKLLCEIPISYLRWAMDDLSRCDGLSEKIELLCYFDKKELNYIYENNCGTDCIGSLISLYRKIMNDAKWLPPPI
jgi:uncharacterized protein (DUF3820 family)